MAAKILLAAGLFIVIFTIQSCTGSSQLVPDGLVYTEVQKTLVQGVKGILTCRFYGEPYAVYWLKGHDTKDLNPMISWHEGQVSGPKYNNGSCDMDSAYSLIIKNVSTTDAGRIYCKVINYKAILIENYTDISVTDTVISTNPRLLFKRGQGTGILRCILHIEAKRVSWKKGTPSNSNKTLVVLEINRNVAERSGAGYERGLFDITEDYSLVIKDVQIHHEDLYICEVTYSDTGISFQNHTFVNVIAQPLEPFPSIQECVNEEIYDSHYCTFDIKSEITLTCQITKYYPDLNMFFLHGSDLVATQSGREMINADGTKNKTITITAKESNKLYTCVASDIPGYSGNKSTSVLLTDGKAFNPVPIVVLTVFIALVLISSATYVIWRRRHRNYRPVKQLEDEHEVSSVSYSQVQQEEHDGKDANHPQDEQEVSYPSPVSNSQVRQDEDDGKDANHPKDEHEEVSHSSGQDLTEEEMKILGQIAQQHYRKIYNLIGKENVLQNEKIIGEISTTLLNINEMLANWDKSRTSSQISEVLQPTSEKEDEEDYHWPSDSDLRWISRHANEESIERIFKELNSGHESGCGKDEETRFDILREWRNSMADESVEKKHQLIFQVLEANELGGLLPPLKGPYIYKVEVVDMAFHLLIKDLLPFTNAKGISATKLVSYRPTFKPSHLKIGTINVLARLLKFTAISANNNERLRSDFCASIGKLQCQNASIRGTYEYGMSYGELFSISEAMAMMTEDREEDRGDAICVKLQKVLQLTDQEIADVLTSSRPVTEHDLFKIWKEKLRPLVFNYRADLALELRRIGMHDLADEVIAGKYIDENTSLTFIRNIVNGLDQDQLRNLRKLLRLDGEDAFTTQIHKWVANWTKEMKHSWFVTKALMNLKGHATDKISSGHIALNDQLVENGFLDLAREIMIIEQQLAHKRKHGERKQTTPKHGTGAAMAALHSPRIKKSPPETKT